MVSTVIGRLAPGRDVADLLRAAFPGGSMTGAPKIAAMKLIAQLEPLRRGVYSGCLGYFDVRGGCDLNIVIRSLIQHAGVAHVHAGGGIVADSQPDEELAEAMIKAAPLLRAVEAMRSPDRAAQPTPV
jgi:para-aminobenzoate synthetase component 1